MCEPRGTRILLCWWRMEAGGCRPISRQVPTTCDAWVLSHDREEWLALSVQMSASEKGYFSRQGAVEQMRDTGAGSCICARHRVGRAFDGTFFSRKIIGIQARCVVMRSYEFYGLLTLCKSPTTADSGKNPVNTETANGTLTFAAWKVNENSETVSPIQLVFPLNNRTLVPLYFLSGGYGAVGRFLDVGMQEKTARI